MMLRVKNNPYDPSNRRISILVKNDADGSAPASVKGAETVGGPTPAPAAGKDDAHAEAKGPATVAPAGDAQSPSPQQQAPAKPSASTPAAKAGLMDKMKAMLPGKK